MGTGNLSVRGVSTCAPGQETFPQIDAWIWLRSSEEERGEANCLAEMSHLCGQSYFGVDAVGEAYLSIFKARRMVATGVALVKFKYCK